MSPGLHHATRFQLSRFAKQLRTSPDADAIPASVRWYHRQDSTWPLPTPNGEANCQVRRCPNLPLPDHPIHESSLPSPEAVRVQLQAILASRQFATATRARRFLTHIVEQTLAGQTDAIKELVLGIEVFDRPADFDPKVDTIVRVEAGKLRKRLEEYYASEGAADLLRIEVPKGSYVPQFLQGIWIDPISLPHGRCARISLAGLVHGRSSPCNSSFSMIAGKQHEGKPEMLKPRAGEPTGVRVESALSRSISKLRHPDLHGNYFEPSL